MKNQKNNTTHEFNGQKYKEASKHQKEWGSTIISEFNLIGSESVLDLGCGDGELTKQISYLLPHGKVIGIDASEGMICTAKKLETENLKFEKIDINEISYSEEFDIIFSNATLHWVKDHQKLLGNCFKALKPGGILRFNFAGNGNCSNFFSVIQQIIKHRDYENFFKSFEWPWYMPDIEKYKTAVLKSNFKNINIWEENADRYFSDKTDMIKWIDQPSIVPFIKMVNGNLRDEFRSQVIQMMIDKTLQTDGSCFETFRRINVYAVK